MIYEKHLPLYLVSYLQISDHRQIKDPGVDKADAMPRHPWLCGCCLSTARFVYGRLPSAHPFTFESTRFWHAAAGAISTVQ
jgi:hypothetical protein